MRRAEARGIRFGGALPIFVAPTRASTDPYGNPDRAYIHSRRWHDVTVFAHELATFSGSSTRAPRPRARGRSALSAAPTTRATTSSTGTPST